MQIRLLVALALIAAACSGETADTTTVPTATDPTTTSTTTTVPTTTSGPTTTIDDRPRSPINGLPVEDAEILDRRVLALKIDNHWNARPQSGILAADAVFEILVEGGLTRFMTVFHGTDTELVGPIRSGRPSDAALIRPLEATLAISGGQPWVINGIAEIGVNLLGDTRPGMFRVSDRPAPHNLYGNTMELRTVADERGYPDDPPPVSLWGFGEMLTTGEEANEISFTFSDTTTTVWRWDGETYLRSIDGGESNWIDPDGEPQPITADVLVALIGEQYTASSASGAGTSVPATSTVGAGPFHIFSGGRVLSGTWAREDAADPFVLTTETGEEMLVPAARPWVSVVPDSGAVAWDQVVLTTTTTTGG